MRLTVDHVTRYHYAEPVRSLVQSHRLTPSVFDGQKVLDWTVSVSDGVQGARFRDGAGDQVQGWTVAGPISTVEVRIKGVVDTFDTSGILRNHREIVAPEAYLRDTPLTEADAAICELARLVPGADALSRAHGLSAAVADAIAYRPGTTHARTTAAEALALGEGVCQDQAHALIAAARDIGLPARYVSGYLLTSLVIDDEAPEFPPSEAAHAWAEVFITGIGWIGFDPANRCCPDERYIRLGSGFDAQDAAPIRGVARGQGEEDLEVEVKIAEAAGQSQQ